jgi:secondary thiamine-phosphate synthase enzyme
MTYQQQVSLSTKGHRDMHDLTEQLTAIVSSSGIKTGLTHVFNVGSTAALGTIEFEPGLQQDLPAILDKLIPPSRNYGHEQTWHDGNGHSHLQATLLGPSLTVPIAEASSCSGLGSKSFISNATCAGVSALSW